jgi:hypothetical protein
MYIFVSSFFNFFFNFYTLISVSHALFIFFLLLNVFVTTLQF